jgi:NADH-quinone oxidoreductase subunit G
MPKLNIDGTEYEVESGTTLIEACGAAGIEIPRFCYHERLSIAGNCRMCLIEVVGGPPKPQASCAMSINDLRPGKNGEPPAIRTNSEMVKKAREGVMEFLLLNHPLDCPICDQGGECDLQDQAMGYGIDSSRYHENKRAVEEKYLGPLVKTVMTRCIQCTRCVRFMTEVAGVEEMGAIGRGEDMEIVGTIEKGLTSELSANIIDLCPVGALTSRPTAFHGRPWEYVKTESIDVMDGLGANIRIDSRGKEVVRILPRVNDAINEEWISDKTRYVADGLKTQRLDRPYIRENGRLRAASWDEALQLAGGRLKAAEPSAIGAVAGPLAGAEELFALKDLLTRLGSPNIDGRPAGSQIDPALGRDGYLFNTTAEGIDQADLILIIGANPRLEAPVLNARIRRRWRAGGLQIGVIGQQTDLTYGSEYLGPGPATMMQVASGMHPFAGKLRAAKRPMLIVGEAAINRPDGRAVLGLAAKIAVDFGMRKPEENWNGFNVLQTTAAATAALDLGVVPGPGGADANAMAAGGPSVLYLLGADEMDLPRFDTSFVIYQGSHGDAGAHRADVILPGAAYTEKSATYVNTEGRPQMTNRAVFPPGEAKEDWAILRALSAAAGQTLAYDTLGALRAQMYKSAPHLAALGQIKPAGSAAIEQLATSGGNLTQNAFGVAVADFYLTNPIARASATMAEMSRMKASLSPGHQQAAE